MTAVQKLYILLCGFEILPKTISTRNRGHRFILSEPVSAYLIETNQGFVLFDTGINTEILNDPDLLNQYYTRHGWTPPIVKPHHELLYQLELLGLSTTDIRYVILSHMHLDHTGGLKHFRHAPVIVQRSEYEYAFDPNHSPVFFDCDYNDPSLNWDIIEGDRVIMPGLQVIDTCGHTPGHQSLIVELPNAGTWILVADAGDLAENFSEVIAPGETFDLEAALSSIHRIKQIANNRNADIILGHDPQFIQTLRLAPEWYS